MKKTFLLLILSFILVFVFTSCNKGDETNNTNLQEPSTEDVIDESSCEHVFKYDFTCGKCNDTTLTLKESIGLEYDLNDDRKSWSVTGIGYCTDEYITIPSTYGDLPVTKIGESAFKNCKQIKCLVLKGNSKIESIENSAFEGCNNLTSVILGGPITNIAPYAFYASALECVTIKRTVENVDLASFALCIWLTDIYYAGTINDWYKNPYSELIGNTKNLYLFDENNEYYDATSLTEITIPDDIREIKDSTFSGFDKLTKVTIPSSVKSIGNNAFIGCDSLSDVYYTGTMEQWCKIEFSGGNYPSINYCNPMRPAQHFYIVDENGEYFEVTEITIPESVTEIKSVTFHGFDNLTKVTIPNTVTSIQKNSFYECPCMENHDGIIYVDKWVIGCDDNITTVALKNGTVGIADSVFEGCTSLTSIEIPNSVTSIGDRAFSNCTSLTSITIGDGVTSMGDHVFSDCISLKSITIPNSVTSIGNSAFSNCTSLTSIEIPNSVTSIGKSAFYGCTSLASITLPFVGDGGSKTHFGYIFGASSYSYNDDYVPTSLKEVIIIGGSSIGYNAFSNCTSLTSVTVGDGVTSIGNHAFWGCTSLTSVTIPNSVTSIGNSTFSYCSSLTSVTIPNSVTSIGNSTFSYCSSLTSIKIPNSVTSIGEDAFSKCTSLTVYCEAESKPSGWDSDWNSISYNSDCPVIWGSMGYGKTDEYRYSISIDQTIRLLEYIGSATEIVIPSEIEGKKVTSIGKSAFYGCTSITSVTIGDGVTSIGEDAFSNCTSLTNATIANSVTSIGKSAFYGCTSLASITLPFVGDGGSKTHFGYIFGASSYSYNDDYVPTSLKEVIIIGGSSIGYNAFSNCTSLTSVTVGDGVTSIGDYAFSDCTSLTSVTIEDGVTSIGDHAFSDCTSLKSITIPNSVASIGTSAFSNCSSLTSVTIGDGVTSIGDHAFYSCTSLKSITIPNSVASIGNSTFSDCSSLISIEIPNSVTSIGNHAFWGCTSLTSVTIPNSVTSIGNSTFSYCSSLTSVTIPNSVTSIGNFTFSYCSSLTSIKIPNSVTSIGEDAFSKCTSLTIYCEAESKPSGWDSDWNSISYNSDCPVIWGSMGYGKTDEYRYSISINQTIELLEYTGSAAEIVIPSEIEGKKVTSIGKSAFYGCTSITSVTIGDDITSIGYSAFSGCTSLASITLPFVGDGGSKTHFGYIFGASSYSYNDDYVPTSLKEVIITGGSSIDEWAFLGCTSLTSITIPNSVTSIGEDAFSDCTSLTSITIPNSVTSIGEDAFSDCTSLTSITIPDSVTSIGEGALNGCKSLTNITIPFVNRHFGYIFGASLYNYNDSYVPTSLKEVKITGGSSIGEDAFRDCAYITSIIIPDSVTSIGSYAFFGCDSLAICCEASEQPNGWDRTWNVSDCPVYWYSESEPTTSGNYWHYGDNGEIIVW